MKPLKIKMYLAVLLAAVVAFAILFSSAVMRSTVFVNSKTGLALLVAIGVGFFACKLLTIATGDLQKHYSNAISSLDKERKELEKKQTAVEEKSAEYARKVDAIFNEPSDVTKLRKKLESIEDFRNSFPCVIAPGYVIYNIIRTELITGSFSKWQIVGSAGAELFECSVLRPDVQTYKEMLMLVRGTDHFEEIPRLDQSTELIYE